MKYKLMKTTMGRKYYVRMADDEVAERILYRIALVVLPFITSVLMMVVWLGR